MNDPRTISERLAAIGIRHEPAPPNHGGRILFHEATGIRIGNMLAGDACEMLETTFVVATKQAA